MTSGVAKLPG